MEDVQDDQVDISQGTLPSSIYIPPSIHRPPLLLGRSYAHYSPCPVAITPSPSTDSIPSPSVSLIEPTQCILGVDEAGRGPVLGPMVYSAFYLPLPLHRSLLAEEHQFNDSKVLTPGVRSNLMRLLCSPGHPLQKSCGWAVKVLSAQDISAGMQRPGAAMYNLNAQAMDATVEIIRGIVEERGVDVKEVYIDTIGNPQTYQKKLERIFPSLKITVAKKADALFPCVSAASVCAKVTRDAALEVCYEELRKERAGMDGMEHMNDGWGSGYPSDSKCVTWLKKEMHPLFGWGNECRFSWGTAKELLEVKAGLKVDWPTDEDEEAKLMSQFFIATSTENHEAQDELRDWYGRRPKEIF
ncbi:ribonuclease H2 subunit A [Emydomyces testavorans]|uniref:Ribonuclease n=1 Tax=Emydomyces testavorans TaxID=2070801 RepID=A0AAF0DR90_9EURO|nr:ribonuclease H2 subunit A [Emydomyces testavorans]